MNGESMENDWKKRLGVVYSTDPDFQFDTGEREEKETLPAGSQKLHIRKDRKNRKGKTVTLIEGFRGTENDLKTLARKIKSRLGVGGSVSGGAILIQGDFRDRIVQILEESGYHVRSSGG